VVVAAAEGRGAGSLIGARVPAATSLAARAMQEGTTVTIPDMTADPDVLAEARAVGFGPGIYLPMQAEDGPIGSLVLAREREADPFNPAEVAAAEVFASAAGIVLALGSARDALEGLKISAEHERIARDLHDTVIQRLFALGMRLQAAERLADPPVAERIRATVDSIDEVIREIRETIFDLNRPRGSAGGDVRSSFRQVVHELTESLHFEPRLAFRGPVETVVDDSLLAQLVSVLRESLSNISRHAEATTADVVLAAGEANLTLSVSDDGVGIPEEPAAGHGLANMGARAEQLGGTLSVIRRSPRGTLVQWSVPVSA
jgi:signal transduction histidine kinase